MFEWLPRRAKEDELAVAKAILDVADDRRTELLLEQFRAARRVERHVKADSMRVTVPWTTQELMVDLDRDVVSHPVLVITDGLVVDTWAILGVRDLCVAEVDGGTYWQIAVGAGPRDDRRCLLGADGVLTVVPAHDAPVDEFEPVGTDPRSWIAALVGA